MFYAFGVEAFDKQVDFMLDDFCDNVAAVNWTREGGV
jgi:hypothetical protein